MEPTDNQAHRTRPRSRLACLGATAVVLVLLVTACGQGSDDPDAVASLGDAEAGAGEEADADTAAKSFEDAMLDFAECMREQGIDMPDPSTRSGGGSSEMVVVDPGVGDGGVDLDEEQFSAAEKQCGHLMEGVMPDLSPEEMDRMQDEMLAFARCMRDHGIDMPDPEADGSMTMGIGGDGIDLHDPDFQAAEKECRPEGATGVETPSGGADPRGAVSP